MKPCWQEQLRPGAALHTLVQEATAALIAMDAGRLEELARCCADLNRELQAGHSSIETADAAEKIAADAYLFRRVLIETRANLVVFTRLHTIRLREYIDAGSADALSSVHKNRLYRFTEDSYGDN